MRPGSVDRRPRGRDGRQLRAEPRPGETVVREGVTIVGETNWPATMPLHASQMYSRNVASFLALLVREGELAPDWDDEIVRESAVTRDGRVLKEAA